MNIYINIYIYNNNNNNNNNNWNLYSAFSIHKNVQKRCTLS